MKMNYNVTGAERKALVKAIEELAGEKAKYLGMPTAAYRIGGLMVSKTGELEGDFDEELTSQLEEAGFTGEAEDMEEADVETGAQYEDSEETEESEVEAEGKEADDDESESSDEDGDAEDGNEDDEVAGDAEVEESEDTEELEPISLTVTIPITGHSGASLRNLVNLVFTRAELLNRSLGTGFWVNEELVEHLQSDGHTLSVDAFAKAIEDFEVEHGRALTGLSITPVNITFSGLPETTDTAKLHAFTTLMGMMNRQTVSQKRIQAKVITEKNEKYAFRIWLTRLGMNGNEYKEDRRILMKNLTGHSAFRTEADKERWMKRQAEKKEALKAAKAEAAREEAIDNEDAENEGDAEEGSGVEA